MLLDVVIPFSGAYVIAAWYAARRPRIIVLALWVGASLLAGYVEYRYQCTTPLVCDVGGTSHWFLEGNPWYFERFVSLFATGSAVGFGAVMVLVRSRQRQTPPARLWPGTLALGTLSGVGGWIVAVFALKGIWPR